MAPSGTKGEVLGLECESGSRKRLASLVLVKQLLVSPACRRLMIGPRYASIVPKRELQTQKILKPFPKREVCRTIAVIKS